VTCALQILRDVTLVELTDYIDLYARQSHELGTALEQRLKILLNVTIRFRRQIEV